jgi:hypothetical protein
VLRRLRRDQGPDTYPQSMYRSLNPPVEVTVDQFLTQQDAAEQLGVWLLTIGRLIAEKRLQPATCQGTPGVTRASVDAELQRRKSGVQRAKSALKSFFHWLSP